MMFPLRCPFTGVPVAMQFSKVAGCSRVVSCRLDMRFPLCSFPFDLDTFSGSVRRTGYYSFIGGRVAFLGFHRTWPNPTRNQSFGDDKKHHPFHL